jgi:hypothetical protein
MYKAKYMKHKEKRPKDRHLGTPSEANRDKHINFLALEDKEGDPADAPATGTLADEPTDNNNQGLDKTFNLIVDDVPYIIKAKSFMFNDETRFYISVNGNPSHVFTWDTELKQLRPIDDNASTLPDSLEKAISDKLLHMKK